MPDSPGLAPDPWQHRPIEPVRLPEHELDDLAARLAALTAQSQTHDDLLDRLAAEQAPPAAAGLGPDTAGPFILLLDADAYDHELRALTGWVDEVLLPVYGREISTQAPWCPWWPKHREAVARLHALWLAWQQHLAPDAGPSGPAVWHRDFLDHTMAQLRAPTGPFAACMTSPKRPAHRLLPPPHPATSPPPGPARAAA